jgi:hypothetical protein
LAPLFENVAQVGIGLRQERVLLYGQSAEMRRSKQQKMVLNIRIGSTNSNLDLLQVLAPFRSAFLASYN